MTAYGLRGQEENFVDSSTKDREILSHMRDIYNQTSSITQTFWNTANIDARFYAGDQSVWGEVYSNVPSFRRKQFSFNKIKRIVNMISGYQRRNRNSTICIPQEDSDQETADQFSELLLWANNNSNGLYTLSDAFEGALVTGMNLLSVWMDYRSDPLSGDIRVDNMSYNGYMIDPYFTKQDLSDCNYIWTRKFLSKRQLGSILPQHKKEIEEISGAQKDGKFNFLPENYNVDYKNLISYDEFWYLDFRPAEILVDLETGETKEWVGPEENKKIFLKRFPQVKLRKIQKKTTKLAIVVNGNKVVYDGKNPYNIDSYPFIPVMAYYQPELPYYEWRIQGVVRSLRDSQFLYNRRKQIELDILESQINSGMKVMEDSLIDDNDAFKNGQGQALFIKKDAPLGMGSVEPFMPPQIPPSMMELSAALSREMTEISGVNEELLGSADDDKAGILSMLRQGAGLTTLGNLFDQLDLSQKIMGQVMMEMIQNNFTAGKVRRILNKDPSEQFYNKAFQKFDCQIVEGTNTSTQKQMAFKQALYLKEVGVPVPDDFLLEMSTLQNKGDLIKGIQSAQEQAQQMQQMQQQLEMAQLQAQIRLANARAVADEGLGIERVSRVKENQALAIERRAKAVSDMESASLDKVKAAKELTDIDLNQLIKAVELIQKIQEQSIAKDTKILKEGEDATQEGEEQESDIE